MQKPEGAPPFSFSIFTCKNYKVHTFQLLHLSAFAPFVFAYTVIDYAVTIRIIPTNVNKNRDAASSVESQGNYNNTAGRLQ
jgi:hypothetical protein